MQENKGYVTYVYVDNHKFKIYLDRPLEKCMTIKAGRYLITAHIKIQKLDEIHNSYQISSQLIKTILRDIVEIHYKDKKSAPWIYNNQNKIAITSYQIQIFVDSVI